MSNQSYHDFEMLLDTKASLSLLETKASKDHTHVVNEIVDLQNLIAGKCELAHSHSISDISGLQSLLQSFASVSHSHSIDDIPEVKKQLSDMNLQIGVLSSQLYHLNSLITELQ
jgi:hypothetical protein